MRIEELLVEAAARSTNSSLNNLFGYAASSLTGFTAATAIGSWSSIVGITFVGGLALYVPYYLLKQTLQYFKITSELLHSTLDVAFHAGAAATGALIFGASMPAAVFCALAGIVLSATIIACFFPRSHNAPEQADNANTNINQNTRSTQAESRSSSNAGWGIFNSTDNDDGPRVVELDDLDTNVIRL